MTGFFYLCWLLCKYCQAHSVWKHDSFAISRTFSCQLLDKNTLFVRWSGWDDDWKRGNWKSRTVQMQMGKCGTAKCRARKCV